MTFSSSSPHCDGNSYEDKLKNPHMRKNQHKLKNQHVGNRPLDYNSRISSVSEREKDENPRTFPAKASYSHGYSVRNIRAALPP